MEFLTSTILSGIAFDAIKKGVNITSKVIVNNCVGVTLKYY